MGRFTERDEHGEVYVKQHDYVGASKRLAEYEEAEDEGLLLQLSCAIGDTVYVLAECENISPQLDGTLYDADGSPGTATGYYCPYEDNCPFEDGSDCEVYKKKTAVFEDIVNEIVIDESGIHIFTLNCCVLGIIGRDVFLERSAADIALATGR